ncbi:MAG: hypothetical protein IIB42_05660, partial [Candidatus Marinimicrobia bacterium]|nr:hypothetical protein [Candidatus Neomarinimicrobiota bacterium]
MSLHTDIRRVRAEFDDRLKAVQARLAAGLDGSEHAEQLRIDFLGRKGA